VFLVHLYRIYKAILHRQLVVLYTYADVHDCLSFVVVWFC